MAEINIKEEKKSVYQKRKLNILKSSGSQFLYDQFCLSGKPMTN